MFVLVDTPIINSGVEAESFEIIKKENESPTFNILVSKHQYNGFMMV